MPQAKQLTGREPSPTHQQSSGLKFTELCPPEQQSALPTTSPSHQEACTSLLDRLIHQRADSRSKKTTILQRVKQKPHSEKDRQDEKAEGYVPSGTRVPKEQDKTPEKQLNEVEIGNHPEKEFRIMRVKIIQDLGRRMEVKIEKMQEMSNKHLEELKNKQTETNNTITEMKTTLEGINSRITEAKERISDLEERKVESTAAEKNKEKRMKRNEDSLRDCWDNIKHNNICIIGVPEGEEREKGPEKIFEEIIVKNFQIGRASCRERV